MENQRPGAAVLGRVAQRAREEHVVQPGAGGGSLDWGDPGGPAAAPGRFWSATARGRGRQDLPTGLLGR